MLLAQTQLNASTLGRQTVDLLLHRAPSASLLTLLFATIAARLHFVTIGGAIAGSFLSIVIYVSAGPGGFAALGMVFALTAAATRIGYARKERLGAHEQKTGRRAMQVLANLSLAALFSLLSITLARPWLLICATAALAEAASDTVSSELGEAWADRVYLVTTFKHVALGTDGGISLAGTLAGLAASVIVAWVSYVFHVVPRYGAVLAAGAAFLGTFVDSLLGATMERRGWLNNNAVNFLSTGAAAGLAAALLAI